MTDGQYWYGDVRLSDAYIEADRLKSERANHMAWLQGQYVYCAIGSFTECFTSFGKKGKIKIAPYLKEPFALSKSEQESRKEREIAERKERIRKKLTASVKMGSGAHGSNS
jgi:hypothetical protein